MAQAIIQPSRMRRAFNGWCKGLFAGQHFDLVLNLGCGHNVDRQGGTYNGYWMADQTTCVDKETVTTYPDYEIMLVGDHTFTNPVNEIADAENLFTFADHTFDMVFCNWVIYHCDHVKVLEEIVRVLVPKGKLFVSWMCKVGDDTIYGDIRTHFRVIAEASLWCDKDLDGREGIAQAFWGEKR